MNNEKRIADLDWWQGEVRISPLEGGITNHNYLVERSNGTTTERFFVRLGDDIPVHHIQRSNELNISKAAHAAEISPAVRYHEPGLMVLEFINGETLTPERVREQHELERIVPLIKQCHIEVPLHLRGAPVMFWVFHVVRDYAATLESGNSNHVSRLPALLDANNLLEHYASPFEIVFGHNDLLAANFIDDGICLWLIDWEYGGFNSPLFDLGGLASNNELSEVQEYWLLETYFEEAVSEDRWIRYQAMKTASLLRETLWSMVSELHSSLDFDYAAYTHENLQRFEQSMHTFRKILL